MLCCQPEKVGHGRIDHRTEYCDEGCGWNLWTLGDDVKPKRALPRPPTPREDPVDIVWHVDNDEQWYEKSVASRTLAVRPQVPEITPEPPTAKPPPLAPSVQPPPRPPPIEAPAQQKMLDGKKSNSTVSESATPSGECWDFLPKMDEVETLDTVPWLLYCACCGCGLTTQPRHCLSMSNCAGCVTRFDTWACFNLNGFCHCVQTCCCFTVIHQSPPRGRSSRCICCNLHGCGTFPLKAFENVDRFNGYVRVEAAQMFDFVLFDQFVPCYAACCGCGFAPWFVDFCSGLTKCGPAQCKYEVTPPCGEEAGCCFHLQSCWWCHCHVRIPPVGITHNPIIACCGHRLKQVKAQATKAAAKSISKFDTSGDGLLDVEEFIALMKSGQLDGEDNIYSEQPVSELVDIFEKLDADQSGSVNVKELIEFLLNEDD